jgi:hypothetical protein
MEKNIILKDSVNISDSKIRGVVVLEKEDGTVVFKKENMIVEGGRNYIKNLFFTKVSGGTENRKIYTLKFGTSTALTEVGNTDLAASVSTYTINTTSLQWKKLALTVGSTNPTTVVVGEYFYNTSSGTLYIGTNDTDTSAWDDVDNSYSGVIFGDSAVESALTGMVEGDLFVLTGVDPDPEYTLREYNGENWINSEKIFSAGLAEERPEVTGENDGIYYFNTDSGLEKLEYITTDIDTDLNTWEEASNYTTGTSFPTTSLDENDLFYNTDLSNLYIYGKAMIVSLLSSPEIGVKVLAVLRGTDAQQLSISELGLFLNDTPTATMFSRLVFDGFPLTTNSAYILSYYIYF